MLEEERIKMRTVKLCMGKLLSSTYELSLSGCDIDNWATLLEYQFIYWMDKNKNIFAEKLWDPSFRDDRFLIGLHTSVNSNLESVRFIWTAELEMQRSKGIAFLRKPF